MKDFKKVYEKSNDIASREIDNELFLLPIYKTTDDISKMYILNETAMAMWTLMDGERTLQEIVDKLCTDYHVSRKTIEKELQELVKDLRSINAIQEKSSR
ncbi:MAG: PqqD family protein [Candidatus Omnitrophota bacterium]|nr:MAG: PqqD family protein [Candidatus Omnitrophota bacterium]